VRSEEVLNDPVHVEKFRDGGLDEWLHYERLYSARRFRAFSSGTRATPSLTEITSPPYCDCANCTGFVVLPATPLRAATRARGESHIGVAQRSFFQEVHNRIFYSLHDLNEALRGIGRSESGNLDEPKDQQL
jgi:hypothetical protein